MRISTKKASVVRFRWQFSPNAVAKSGSAVPSRKMTPGNVEERRGAVGDIRNSFQCSKSALMMSPRRLETDDAVLKTLVHKTGVGESLRTNVGGMVTMEPAVASSKLNPKRTKVLAFSIVTFELDAMLRLM